MNPLRKRIAQGAAYPCSTIFHHLSRLWSARGDEYVRPRLLAALIFCLALAAGLGGRQTLSAAGYSPWPMMRKAATLPASPAAMQQANGPVCSNFTNKTTADGLGANIVGSVHIAGSTIYVATANFFGGGGVSISTDGGTSFTNRTTANGLGSNFVVGVYAQGGTVYAATTSGLSISTDGGTSFVNKTTTNGLGSNSTKGVYVVGSTVYVPNFGLSISTDGGTSFVNKTVANSGLSDNNVNGVFVVGSTVYAATNNGLSISTDGGASFTGRTTANGLGNNQVIGVYAVGSTVYAATSNINGGGGLAISTDGGATFSNRTTTNGLGSNLVRGVYVVGSTVYAATEGGLSISTDGGTSFANYTAASGLGNNRVNGVFATATTIYAGTTNGLSFCPPPAPAMAVSGNGNPIANGSATPSTTDSTDFGGAAANTGANANSFTIANTGSGTLNLTGSPLVALSGANASDFSVALQPTSPVAPTNGTTTFLVNFAPTATGTRTATVSIANDDSTKNPYTFAIQGTGTAAPANGPVCSNFTTKTTSDGLGSNTGRSVYAVGSTVYVGTLGGLSISTDGGASFANRTTANGLGDNRAYGVYAAGSTVYAATAGGLSISTDGGASFTNRTTANGLGNNNVSIVYVVGSTVYAATDGGVSISTDGGTSFTNKTTANGLGNNIVTGVYAQGSTVYAATIGGVSISTDGGTSFTNKTTADGLGNNIVVGIFAAGSTVYAATQGGLSISTDGGATFTNRTTANGLGENFVRRVYVAGNTVYAATASNGLSISSDGGTSFTNYTTASGLGNNGVQGVYATATTVYAATNGGGLSFCSPPPPAVAVSGNSNPIANGSTTPSITNNTDFGSAAANTGANANSFTIANTGGSALNLTGSPRVALSGANASDFSVALQPTSPVAPTNGTTTFLVNFAPTATGLRTATISIANDDSTKNPYTFAIQGTGTAAPTSGPACSNFTNKTTANGLGANNVRGVYVVGNTVYAATSGNPRTGGGGLSISTDGGASFTTRTTADGLGHDNVNSVFVTGSTVYAATVGGLSISTDGGASFTNRTPANGLADYLVHRVHAVGSTVYAATSFGLSISTDGGASFTTRTTANGLGNNQVNSVFAVGSTVYAATLVGLSISTDGGASFTTRTTAQGLGGNFVISVYAAGSTVYAGTSNGGLSISTDGGASFVNRTTAQGLGDNGVYGVYALGSTVYAATLGGLSISTDGGASFANYTSASGLGSDETSGVFATTAAVYAATGGGLSSCVPNIAPTITAGGTFTRQQSSPAGAAVQIATVGDIETAAGNLMVAATTVPTGITIGPISNNNGTISATIAAGCNAATGNNTVTLTVTDGGGLTAPATFTVNVTANDSPTVGTYTNQSVSPGSGVTVTPSVAPADNGSIAGVTASASPAGFTGSFSGNPATGAVTITNAAPNGSYTVTVIVTDNCGATVQRTFTLTVDAAPTLAPIPLGIAQGTTTAVMTNVATIGDTETAPSNLSFQISSDGSIFGSSATLNGVAVALVLPPAANGVVKANVTTNCAATTATFTLKVTDALGQTATAPWTVTITANTPPTLSYGNQAFPAGGTPSFNPSAGPSDNGSVTNIALQSITPASGLSLTVNSTTGQVTVTGASIAQSYTVVIRATDDCGLTTDATFTVALPCPTIALTPTGLPAGLVNTAYNQSLSATPAGGNYSFAVSSGLLPQGLTLNANGSFSGAPTQSGTFNFRVTVTGFGNCSAFQDCTLSVNCPSISITTASLPGGTIGTTYNQTLAVSPAGTYSFAVSSGALPPGLTLNAATGAITGTPTTTGTFAFTVTAGNGGCSAGGSFTIAIACASVSLSPATLPGGQAGVAYSQAITVSPAGSYTFSITQGNLPAGLTLNPQTGVISGTPTVTGTSTFTVKARAANGCESTGTHTLTLTCPTITLSPTTLPDGQTGTAYNQQLSATPTGGNYGYSVSGTLPPGLALNFATGNLSGTPTANGSFTFTVTATGFGNCAGSRQYTVVIGNGNCSTISLPSGLPNGSVGQFYSNSVAATPAGNYSYTSSGNLPPGVTLYGSIGLLFGYPTANGSYNFTITATGNNNCTGSKSYTVVIGTGSAPAINDFSGDRRSDFVLRRAAEAQWLIVDSATDAAQTIQWGQAGDLAVPGDFDGDGKADLAGFGKDGHWRIKLSNGGTLDKLWGLGTDVPVAGDYDGDGKTDLAVWRGAESRWYIQRSSDNQTQTVLWGASYAPYKDVAVPGDYDGDGKTDVAVFRTGNGHWYILRSSDGATMVKHWGLGTDLPVAADYDGDGKTDIAVWRGSEGGWYIVRSSDNATESKIWGAAYEPYLDVPAAGDYDGDGKADLTVRRKAENRWYVLQSSDGKVRTITQGKSGDQPVSAVSALPGN